jgi:uncharacterized protein YjdB
VAGSSSAAPCNGVTSITVTPSVAHLSIGDTLTAKAQYSGPACSPSADLTTYRWSSQNAAVAQVDSLTGRLRAMGNGSTQVGVRSAAGTVGILSVIVP